MSTRSGKRGRWREKGRPFLFPVSSRFSFMFAPSQFRRPDYLGAWNRLKLPTTAYYSRLNFTRPSWEWFRSKIQGFFYKYKKQISPKSKALDCNVLFKTLISSYEKESGINIQPGGGGRLLRELTVLGFIRLLTVPLEGWYNLSFLCCTRRK